MKRKGCYTLTIYGECSDDGWGLDDGFGLRKYLGEQMLQRSIVRAEDSGTHGEWEQRSDSGLIGPPEPQECNDPLLKMSSGVVLLGDR